MAVLEQYTHPSMPETDDKKVVCTLWRTKASKAVQCRCPVYVVRCGASLVMVLLKRA